MNIWSWLSYSKIQWQQQQINEPRTNFKFSAVIFSSAKFSCTFFRHSERRTFSLTCSSYWFTTSDCFFWILKVNINRTHCSATSFPPPPPPPLNLPTVVDQHNHPLTSALKRPPRIQRESTLQWPYAKNECKSSLNPWPPASRVRVR